MVRLIYLLIACLSCFAFAGAEDPLVYLKAVSAQASSFDQTPVWAPKPDAMAAADGDILTRWASDPNEPTAWVIIDLGEDRTVTEIIIRWERAAATNFQIDVSTDGSQWNDIYHDSKFAGGTADIQLPPTKCRYIKVICKEKLHPDWGYSIWEIEAYGPGLDNPGSGPIKTEFLRQRSQKLESKIESLSSPVISLKEKPFQKGFNLISWEADEEEMQATDILLFQMKEKGFDTVAIVIPTYQDNHSANLIYLHDQLSQDMPSDEKLKHIIATSHRLGLRVMLKVHVDIKTGEPRTRIVASDKWFGNYEKLITKYASLANDEKVELFSVGTELEGTTAPLWTPNWISLIERIRKIYNGALTYSANWTEYPKIGFWQALDFIGIDAYFPLDGNNLKNDWNGIADKLEDWLKTSNLKDKKILFTEIGYSSSSGAAKRPWIPGNGPENQKEQADAFNAMFNVLSKRAWFSGYFIWYYWPLQGIEANDYNPQNKKADTVIQEWNQKIH